jgi:cell division protein FtsX
VAPIFKWLGHGNHSNNKKLNPIINLFLVRIKKKKKKKEMHWSLDLAVIQMELIHKHVEPK